ncbi:MAG: hypothetical protein NTX53_16920 [candidate division WOR-3 bacterium]|nr:hypothetical protein [candidate division WOR-3 bacterium]
MQTSAAPQQSVSAGRKAPLATQVLQFLLQACRRLGNRPSSAMLAAMTVVPAQPPRKDLVFGIRPARVRVQPEAVGGCQNSSVDSVKRPAGQSAH